MKIVSGHTVFNWVFSLIVLLGICATSAQTRDHVQDYFAKAIELSNKNRMEQALETLNKAALAAEEKEDVKALIDCYHHIAIVYLKLNRVESTLFYSDRAHTLLKDVEYPYGDAIHMYIDAVLQYRNNKNFQALVALDEAKQLNNDRNFFNHILLAGGHAYLNLKKYEEASKNFHSLVVNTDLLEKDYLAARAYLGLARLHFETDNMEESAKSGENALELAKKNDFFKEQFEASQQLAQTYEKLGNFDKALQHTQNIMGLRDSIFTPEKAETEVEVAEALEKEDMKGIIKKQDERIEELSESKNRSEITAILMSSFLIIISLLAVSLFRNNQIKLKTNALLQTKNDELKTARDAAVNAMEAKTNFLSTVSHELRTPLYAVTGLTHLLLEENPKENQKEHLKALKFSGDYLLNFINDILHINKIDANKLEPLTIDMNLKKVLNEVLDSLQQSAKANNTKLILDYDVNIPKNLMSDPLKLSQVFMNLVGNAIKFTKNGEVRVIAKMVKNRNQVVTLYFEVKDNGIGISEEQKKTIFEGFEQGSIQINREYGGTGLGLTIVKSLLGLFDSKIHLESELGEGSTFSFELKAKSKDEVLEDTGPEMTNDEYNFKGLHVLVVEDNKINQVITKKMLGKKEITCDIANDGYEAVENAKKNTYNAILMDIHMPGISGEEATIEIRKFDKETPIIALTAISLDDSVESFYAAGCNDVVTKPFKPEIFYQKIGENIFDKKNRAS